MTTKEKTGKICLGIGLAAGLCAILIALVSGSHFHWDSSEGNSNVSIRIGSGDLGGIIGSITSLLGVLAVVALVLGGAFLSIVRAKDAEDGERSETSNKPSSFLDFIQRLKRSRKDSQLGGVCGGLGEHSPVPAWAWRMLFLIFTFCFGVGILPYILMWVCIPEEEKKVDHAAQLSA